VSKEKKRKGETKSKKSSSAWNEEGRHQFANLGGVVSSHPGEVSLRRKTNQGFADFLGGGKKGAG